ncbi:hypothetical protein RY831_01115 [Noviherbaspirillum sp. CPCC 100848]|uniref:Uncharacterized protein n=1 Tax=Noviherbaspirillum album TaxID=3080276 RepID=A0ABU6J2A4_9BURK|nr:hypothetical protein [Noviherbaspirillum sp. CPCC 100848]MEC4717737.1 hypothetical protein [Noviherbaspirillum sp. CPCC 100848]
MDRDQPILLDALRNSIAPGMTIKEIKRHSTRQLVIHGFLIIDDEYGLGFSIANDFEDVDYVSQLPDDLILEELHVMSTEWWR